MAVGPGPSKRRAKSTTDEDGVAGRILKEAVRLFATAGYAATSVAEIVSAAETSKPMLYYHFGDKEGLYRELAGKSYAIIRSEMESILQDTGSTEHLLKRVVQANFNLTVENPDMARFGFVCYFAPEQGAPDVGVKGLGTENFEVLAKIVQKGVDDGELSTDSATVALALSGLIMIWIMGHFHAPQAELLSDGSATRLVGLLMDGVRKK